MGRLEKLPIVSLLIAVAIAIAPFLLASDPAADVARFENRREAAREYLVRHPRLEVDGLGELVLDSGWLVEARSAAEASDSSLAVELPPRMLARSQARLDELIADAYDARLRADPAWRLGVLDGRSPLRNYLAHAFVNESVWGVILAVCVLLFVGIPLERSWGSLVFATFALGAAPAVAEAYRLLDASSGVPWSGGAGLAGALLGAYFIRGLGGHFTVPGWLLLPAWLGIEVFVVRDFWIDDFGFVPWATLSAAIGLGAVIAGGLRLTNLEARIDAANARRRPAGPNPIVVRAARLRSDGDPYQAFDLIQAAWREDPQDDEICEAFYSIAVEVGQPEVAAEAILPRLRAALKVGDVQRAIDYWFPLASKECNIVLEATASVRLGEALLDAGHPEQALFSLRAALDSGVSSAHAARIVNIARDLDEGLTRRAAAIALNESLLDPKLRADFEALVAGPEDELGTNANGSPGGSTVASAGESPPPPSTPLERRVQAEHHVIETTAFPLDLDSDLDAADLEMADLDSDLDLDADFGADFGADLDVDEAHDAALAKQGLDRSALSADALSGDSLPAEERSSDDPSSSSSSLLSGDVLSHWSGREEGRGKAKDVDASLEGEDLDEALLGQTDLETPFARFDFGLRAAGADLVDPRDDETDTDLTPMMDATDEVTSPMSRSAAAKAEQAAHEPSLAVFDQPTSFVEAPPRRSSSASLGAALATSQGDAPRSRIPRESAASAAAQTSTTNPTAPIAAPASRPTPAPASRPPAAPASPTGAQDQTLRALKALEAVPLEANGDWIEVDAADRGKSKLPYGRIQAIAVAAVAGLGPRPVLVLDFVLNWSGDGSETMKSIRFRSDRFDPQVYAPSAPDPLRALTAWVCDLERRSGATCLPNRDVLEGRFERFDSLAAYEREVLMAAAAR